MKRPKTIQLRERGQLTLPKEIRREIGLKERGTLTLFTVGEALVMTSKKLLRAELAMEFEERMCEEKLSLRDLLEGLAQERTQYVREIYGKK